MTDPITTSEAQTSEGKHDFDKRLYALHRRAHDDGAPDRGAARKALAQLRHALTDAEALPAYEVLFTYALVTDDVSPSDLRCTAQAAGLFGLHVQGLSPDRLPRMPEMASGFRRHSLGTSAKLLRGKLGAGQESLDRRFNALLDSDPRDLFTRLRHLFRLMHSHNVPVHFNRLLGDLKWWQSTNPDKVRRVRREWAEDYWRPIQQDKNIAS